MSIDFMTQQLMEGDIGPSYTDVILLCFSFRISGFMKHKRPLNPINRDLRLGSQLLERSKSSESTRESWPLLCIRYHKKSSHDGSASAGSHF